MQRSALHDARRRRDVIITQFACTLHTQQRTCAGIIGSGRFGRRRALEYVFCMYTYIYAVCTRQQRVRRVLRRCHRRDANPVFCMRTRVHASCFRSHVRTHTQAQTHTHAHAHCGQPHAIFIFFPCTTDTNKSGVF